MPPSHARPRPPCPAPQSDIVSLHCPLLPSTFHIINAERVGWGAGLASAAQRPAPARPASPKPVLPCPPAPHASLALMKSRAVLINVSRGGLGGHRRSARLAARGQVGGGDTQQRWWGLRKLLACRQPGPAPRPRVCPCLCPVFPNRLAGAAMDVYETEGPLFFKDYTRYTPRGEGTAAYKQGAGPGARGRRRAHSTGRPAALRRRRRPPAPARLPALPARGDQSPARPFHSRSLTPPPPTPAHAHTPGSA